MRDRRARVSSKEVVTGVFSRHAAAYRDRMNDTIGRGEARGRLRIHELLAVQRGERVLDLGCGPGTLTFMLGEAAGPSGLTVGVDLAPGMLDMASGRGAQAVSFARMDIERLAFGEGSFDAAACGHALQFCTDLRAALLEVHRVLRPGGRFAASVPDDSPDRRRLIEEALDGLLPPAPELPDMRATRELLGDEARLSAELASAGFRRTSLERVHELSRFSGPAELLAKSMRWWAVAWRLESLPEEELGPVHAEALDRLRARAGAGPLEIPGASLVVLAQR